jgi:hypothetical protein
MKTTALQRVINCLKAEKRTLDPSFRSYWKDTAHRSAAKNNIDIADVKQKLEIYDASAEGSSMH